MNYNNPKSSSIKEFIRVKFLSGPLQKTKKAGDKVLDLGCGWGFYFKINPKAYGIDIDKKCIEYLKNLGYKAVLGNITEKLPFKDNLFQWVVCHDVLEHLEINEVEKIFSEIHRILDKNGRFLIIVPNAKGYKSGIDRAVGHKHFVNQIEISRFAEKKFAVEKTFSHPFNKFLGEYFTHNKQVFVLRKLD